jgi:hypothetical protein
LRHKEDVEFLPATKNAINGVHMIEFFPVICAWTDEKDLAFDQLTSAVWLPGWLGLLRLHPFFDPLRDDPRFERIVALLAPK